MTSGGYASPNSIMAYYRNTNASNLTQLSISYNLERYRINTAAASVQFFYSTNGTVWTAVTAGDVAAASLPTGANSYNFTPGLSLSVGSFNITGLNIPTNGDIYLRWNLNTTGGNSQGVGIDDVSVTATFAPIITDAVDYCNLQSPPNGTITQGGAFNVYAQAYEPGVTEAAGIGTGVVGWIGYSSANTDPSTGGWTWVPASFNVQVGNNDELVADIGTALVSGTYYYASRFQLNGGPYRYGGYNGGFWNGTTNVNGVLTVNPSVVDYCNLQFPANATIIEGGSVNVYAQVYEPGVTEAAGIGSGIQGWIGYSTTNVDPSTGVWTWVPATFNVQSGNNDELTANIGTGLVAGTYYYASRFQLGIGAFRYGGYNGGFWNGTTNVNGVLTVQAPEINLQGNAVSIVSGDATPALADHTDFGSVSTVSGTIVRTFTIQNTGTAALSLTGISPYITISGANAADFTVTTIPSSSIATAGNTTFQITFDPSADGLRVATISIANNDTNENPYTFAIQGNGISAPIITSGLTASGNQGSAFSYTITATNTPTSYNATGLPAGLSINTTTGVISGTPTVTGIFNVTITATNGIGSDNQTLVITIGTGPCLSEAFVVNALPAGWVQNTITFTSNYAEFGGNNSELTTLSISNPASLTFTLARTTNATAKDLIVEVSTTSQVAGFTAVATYNHGNTTSGGVTNCTVDLSAYTSFSTVYVRFRKASATTSPWRLDDIQVFCGASCTPAVVSVTPTSGPVNTEVTITASSGDLTGASVFFGGTSATVVSNNGTQMIVIVPNGAPNGTITITDSQPCDATAAFTLISTDNSTCEGASTTTDLIIYDIHDEKTGSGGFITLYNGTAAIVDLTNYSIWRTSTHDDGNEVDYANLTGTIAPGSLGILKVSIGSCGPASTNGTIDGGFNENDGIQLRNAAGTVVVDDVDTYPTAPGYYMVRNTGALSARTAYVIADWNTIPLVAGECYPSAGLTLPTGGASPNVTTHPTYSPLCGSTSAVLTTAGAEGFVGGNALAYQWFFAAPGSATWTVVADGGIYSGATTASLSISVITGVVNYQYYCQIRESSATCYTASNAIKITDTSASTWNGTAWIGGTPTITKAAIIDGTYVTATNGDFSCCSLTVNSGVGRSLTISSGGYVEVQNNITNNGILDVLNNGSLVQISDIAVNTGNIRYNRTTNIRRQDFVYWSSPVAGFANSAVSPGTTLGHQYKWLPTTAGINSFGNWAYANETMVLGKGYCLRGPDSFSLSALANYTATFIGVPNNGVVTIPISRGTYDGANYATGVSTTPGTRDDDNWNLVGNPYPSAIHAIDFLTMNTNIAGFVNIWTHGTLPSSAIADPFYNNYVYNYTPGDYITYNAAGASSGPGVFNGRIAGGQGFFVSMLHTSAATTENLTFNNSLRNIAHNNGQFFRNANAVANSGDLEKHRIWIDLVSSTGASVRSMVGYIENATNGKDRLFDAFSNEKLAFNIFSLLDNEQMLIQGKTLPFDNNDKVNIGVSLPQDGLYKIALGAVDGLFLNPNQNIYLEDKVLNVIYDLRVAPYSFMANKGNIKDRFVLRYTNGVVLANQSFDDNNDVLVISNEELSVQSTKENITNITVFDVLGRKLFESKDIKTNNFDLPINKRNAPLFIQIGLENGTKLNKKTVF